MRKGETPKRKRLERLREQVAERQHIRDEMARTLRRFRMRYRDELGPLVEKLLRLRRDRLQSKSHRRRRSTRARNAYREAQTDYERFRTLFDETEAEVEVESKAPATLTEDEQQRLKSAYRQASKRCHPDMVDPEQKEEAEEAFHELRTAYQQNDLERVESIAQHLEEGGTTSPASSGNLQARIEQMQDRLNELEAEIEQMRASDAYQVIGEVDDWDAYFEELRQQLKLQIRQFHRRRT